MKNILLLGDSIRMQYTQKVKEGLKGRAYVYGPNDNGRWAGYTLNTIRFWMPHLPEPDIVHWNNGLWDMGDDYKLGRAFSLPDEYVSALERTIKVLRNMYGEALPIVMATTTPTAKTDTSKPHEYNELLKDTASRHGIPVNDLFTAIAGDLGANISPDGIHLSAAGIDIAANLVCKSVEPYL